MSTAVSLSTFPHEVGAHCSSTSLRDVFLYDGITISEAMVFGLGSGLGLLYVHDAAWSPTYRMNGRSADLEGKFYQNVGHPIEWAAQWSPEGMAAQIAAGRPVLAQTDIFYLPYYQPPVHFLAHGIVITGVDLAAGTAQVADIADDALITTALDNVKHAMNIDELPMMQPYRWTAAPMLGEIVTAEHIRRALHTNAEAMLTPAHLHEGIPAMQRMADEFPAWADAPDWSWCGRFAYQSMEKRGTGGGSFRYLYADFLAEAAVYLPELTALAAADRMRQAGDLWVQVAAACKQVFVEENPAHFTQAGEILQQIVPIERDLLQALGAL